LMDDWNEFLGIKFGMGDSLTKALKKKIK